MIGAVTFALPPLERPPFYLFFFWDANRNSTTKDQSTDSIIHRPPARAATLLLRPPMALWPHFLVATDDTNDERNYFFYFIQGGSWKESGLQFRCWSKMYNENSWRERIGFPSGGGSVSQRGPFLENLGQVRYFRVRFGWLGFFHIFFFFIVGVWRRHVVEMLG